MRKHISLLSHSVWKSPGVTDVTERLSEGMNILLASEKSDMGVADQFSALAFGGKEQLEVDHNGDILACTFVKNCRVKLPSFTEFESIKKADSSTVRKLEEAKCSLKRYG